MTSLVEAAKTIFLDDVTTAQEWALESTVGLLSQNYDSFRGLNRLGQVDYATRGLCDDLSQLFILKLMQLQYQNRSILKNSLNINPLQVCLLRLISSPQEPFIVNTIDLNGDVTISGTKYQGADHGWEHHTVTCLGWNGGWVLVNSSKPGNSGDALYRNSSANY
jgi:hypothetical protein